MTRSKRASTGRAAPKRKPAGRPGSRRPARAAPPSEDSFARRFDGRQTLERLLQRSGALGDVDDVLGAFKEAVAQGHPPQPVIMALWPDEPRFESPKEAEQLFSNLLGLFELVASGETFDVGRALPPGVSRRERAPRPEALEGAPSLDWLEGAWRFLEDTPRERDRLGHAFDNRQDALVSVIDASGLSDAGFAVVRALAFEVFALLELGGRSVRTVHEEQVTDDGALPDSLREWIEEGLVEAEAAEELPLPEADQGPARDLAVRVVAALWRASAER